MHVLLTRVGIYRNALYPDLIERIEPNVKTMYDVFRRGNVLKEIQVGWESHIYSHLCYIQV